MPDYVRKGEVIETTVDKVAAELVRRGLDPHDRVMITIEPDELIPGRRAARARVIAAGLTDDDIDQLIDAARTEAQPRTDPNTALGNATRGATASRCTPRAPSAFRECHQSFQWAPGCRRAAMGRRFVACEERWWLGWPSRCSRGVVIRRDSRTGPVCSRFSTRL